MRPKYITSKCITPRQRESAFAANSRVIFLFCELFWAMRLGFKLSCTLPCGCSACLISKDPRLGLSSRTETYIPTASKHAGCAPFEFSIHLDSPLLSSSTRRKKFDPRSFGQAVVTGPGAVSHAPRYHIMYTCLRLYPASFTTDYRSTE